MTNERVKELFLLAMGNPTMENVESILNELCQIDLTNKTQKDEDVINTLILITIMLRHEPLKMKILSTPKWMEFSKKFKSIIHDEHFDDNTNSSLAQERLAEFGYGYMPVNGELVKI
ncbi:hypothetical protein D3C76_01700 [compost metagenome]